MQHVAGTKCCRNSCCTCQKLSAHTNGSVAATCPWGMSSLQLLVCVHIMILLLLHVPTTRPCYMSLLHVPATCPCYMSPLHVPATCPCYMSRRCEQQVIQALLHVAAICPCVLSQRVRRPLDTVKETFFLQVSMHFCRKQSKWIILSASSILDSPQSPQ